MAAVRGNAYPIGQGSIIFSGERRTVMGIFDDLKQTLTRRHRRDQETAYIEEATSLVDLEMRHREIDRGRFRRR